MSANIENKPLSVTVAALTRKRPQMVLELIQSLGRMAVPDNCDVTCLIVENDEEPKTQSTVISQIPLPNGVALKYVLETELGIPFGRNRAAKEAIQDGASLLAFVDDDEQVDKDWLVHMIAGYRKTGAALIGGPLRTAPPAKGLTRMQLRMHENITRRYTQKEQNAARRLTTNEKHKLMVVTNNWLAETRLFSEENIWFDEALRFTGGTDSKFCIQVKNRGIMVDWVENAFVYEAIPPERLSFWYQYKRSRDQVNTNYINTIKADPKQRFAFFRHVPGKIIKTILLVVTLPIARGKTLMKLARNMGWLAGHISAIAGKRSKLYEKITGV